MKKSRVGESGTCGFSLVELLTVIAIVAILTAIMFPITSKKSGDARRIRCLDNLREIGGAANLYLGDWDESFPLYALGAPDEEDRSWKDALRPYMKGDEAFLCPSNPVGWGDWQAFLYGRASEKPVRGDETGRYPVSYGLNGFFARANATPKPKAVRLSDLPAPAETILIGETRTYRAETLPLFWPTERGTPGLIHHHHQYVSYAFADGHVRALRAAQTFRPRNLWGPKGLIEEDAAGVLAGDATPTEARLRAMHSEYR